MCSRPSSTAQSSALGEAPRTGQKDVHYNNRPGISKAYRRSFPLNDRVSYTLPRARPGLAVSHGNAPTKPSPAAENSTRRSRRRESASHGADHDSQIHEFSSSYYPFIPNSPADSAKCILSLAPGKSDKISSSPGPPLTCTSVMPAFINGLKAPYASDLTWSFLESMCTASLRQMCAPGRTAF